MKLPTSLAALAALLVANTVPAADALPAALQPCVSMLRDAERLACYDKAVAQIKSGADLPLPSAENMFGAHSAIAPGEGNRDVKREELREIKGVVTSLRRADDGMIVLELDNGQVWRQQDGDATLTIEAGDAVTVMRASLGTFRIADKRGRSSRFKRVR
ncbi:MAG TPA: hypothetical protein VFU13_12505 [Steroidobacteraceae bacterium]|nr:hypothetical protein [Steroidobacteraceae bacterium]